MTDGKQRKVDPEELQRWAAKGMSMAYHASLAPDRIAIRSDFGERSWGALNENTNRLARRLRAAGVGPGDAVALLARNRPEFVEALYAVMRVGGRMTPINWHLTAEEVAYVVDNCEAKVLLADTAFAAAAHEAAAAAPRLDLGMAIGGPIDGFEDYEEALAAYDPSNLDDPVLGTSMLYTSGTTGRPKGVFRKPDAVPSALVLLCRETAACQPATDISLVTGPLYHAAPLGLNLSIPFAVGVGAVLMDKWDAEETLRLTEKYGATHTHMVATMFSRLLALPDEVKQRYDVSSLRWIVHGAAPCPVHVKQAMIDWLGPVVYEYYAATEGGSFWVDSEEWLTKPGTVGRLIEGTAAQILDDKGLEVGPNETGTIYFEAPENRFHYFKAPEKTASAYRGDYFTMGDLGYLDDDGYLFLTGRSAETIIAGGVNIYPQEIDDVLSQHPAVYEVCTVGIPNEDWGESVLSVVEPQAHIEPSEELAEELMRFARERLPDFKRPRRIDFSEDLPRLPTGKILRRQVREPYWEGRDTSI